MHSFCLWLKRAFVRSMAFLGANVFWDYGIGCCKYLFWLLLLTLRGCWLPGCALVFRGRYPERKLLMSYTLVGESAASFYVAVIMAFSLTPISACERRRLLAFRPVHISIRRHQESILHHNVFSPNGEDAGSLSPPDHGLVMPCLLPFNSYDSLVFLPSPVSVSYTCLPLSS